MKISMMLGVAVTPCGFSALSSSQPHEHLMIPPDQVS
jgi:hypothetical protein